MKKLLKSALGAAALLALSMSGTAQAQPDYPFAATGYAGGGGSWLDEGGNFIIVPNNPETEIVHIIAGGDIVIPQMGYWNLQMGGAFLYEKENSPFGGSFSNTQFQGSVIGFWRNPDTGVFGLEAGVQNRSTFNDVKFVKLGGVGEYFFNEMFTFGVFGGALIPIDRTPFGGFGPTTEFDVGFYAGGHATWYVNDNLAFAGFARFAETSSEFDPPGPFFSNSTQRSLETGAKVRYLTPLSGVELYASAAYTKCEFENNSAFGPGTRIFFEEGPRVTAGVKIRLGGNTDSLVGIDRSNALDTDAWLCGIDD